MEIEVHFFAFLDVYSPTGERRVNVVVEEGATIEDLWAKLGIPEKVEKICLVNGTYCLEGKTLREGDSVTVLPMIDGG